MEGKDLRSFQDPDTLQDVFSKIVSGKPGYRTVMIKKAVEKRCECGKVLEDEKFCPECGKKVL